MLMKFLIAPLLLVLGTYVLPAAEKPLLEKVDVFEAGEAGVALYRIPGVVVTGKGTVLAYCEARRNSPADWGEIEVHLKRSTDGGKTWSAATRVAHNSTRIEGNPRKKVGGEHEQTVNNPVAVVDKSGSVHFLYCVNYARCFYMRSDDDGLSFTEPVEITPAFEAFRPRCPWNVLATGPGHGLQTASGRLVVPVWLAYGKNPGDHGPSMAATIYSDDAGKTWHAGEIAIPNEGGYENPNETTLALLEDGRVMLNTRSTSKQNRRLVTTSKDGATGWSKAVFHEMLWEPICMGSLTSLPWGPGWLLFANPRTVARDAAGQEIPGGRGKRENLSVHLSRDNGETWTVIRTLEPGKSAYSDLAVLPDGTVLCFYEGDKKLTVARFNQAWVEGR